MLTTSPGRNDQAPAAPIEEIVSFLLSIRHRIDVLHAKVEAQRFARPEYEMIKISLYSSKLMCGIILTEKIKAISGSATIGSGDIEPQKVYADEANYIYDISREIGDVSTIFEGYIGKVPAVSTVDSSTQLRILSDLVTVKFWISDLAKKVGEMIGAYA